MAARPGSARPGTAARVVIRSSVDHRSNPAPAGEETSVSNTFEHEIEEYVSNARLRELTGEQNLANVTTLEMTVNTTETSLGRFGASLPNLNELKLSGSIIASVRDIGTTLSHISVLWMARCGLQDLDGISSMYSLKELYLSFNDIKECSALTMLDQLEVLDFEGNRIEEFGQVEFLGLLPALETLTMDGNPVTSEENFHGRIFDLLPTLRSLDGLGKSATSEEIAAQRSRSEQRQIQESIKQRTEEDPSNFTNRPSTARPTTAARPTTGANRPRTGCRPRTAMERAASVEEGGHDQDDGSSALTHGTGMVFQGNPLKALMARRQQNRDESSPTSAGFGVDTDLEELLNSVGLGDNNNDEIDGEDDASREDVLADLRDWREQFSQLTDQLNKGESNTQPIEAPDILVLDDQGETRKTRSVPPPKRSHPRPPTGDLRSNDNNGKRLPKPPTGGGQPRRPRTSSGIRRPRPPPPGSVGSVTARPFSGPVKAPHRLPPTSASGRPMTSAGLRRHRSLPKPI